jgi:hypothetical protein
MRNSRLSTWIGRKSAGTSVACVLSAPFVMSIGSGNARSGRLRVPSGETKVDGYNHDAKGLQKQYESYLKAVEKGDGNKMKDSFAAFALPNPEAWFAQYFANDRLHQLAWDEESEVDGYRTSTAMLLRRFMRGPHYSVHCEPNRNDATNVKPRAEATLPLTQVPIEKYNVKFSGEDGHRREHLVNLVFVDGAFHYMGKRSYPFWSTPDATRKPTQ